MLKRAFGASGTGGRQQPPLTADARIARVATCSYIKYVKTVGVRELKNCLSAYLRRVRQGERVLVTDRGELVAELRPLGYAAGKPLKTNRPERYPVLDPVGPEGLARQLLDAERGER